MSTASGPQQHYRCDYIANASQDHRPVVVAWHRFGPYHHARLRAAATRMPVLGLEMSTVDKVNDWSPVEADPELRLVTAFAGADLDHVGGLRIAARLRELLWAERPRAVAVHGWGMRSARALMLAAITTRTPMLVMSESNESDAPRRWPRELVKRRLLRLARAGLVGGSPQAMYLATLGMPADCIFTGYDSICNEHFGAGADKARADGALRHTGGLPDRYFLASARFVPAKNLLGLLDAYAFYRRQVGDTAAWSLVVLGDGPMRSELECRRSDLGLENAVLMPGFMQYEALPAYYGLASAFVHASSTEPWGLVVNEAMAAGLPVIVSSRCGCATDLVSDGVNGFTFDPLNSEALGGLLARLAHGGVDLSAMGQASRTSIAGWGAEQFALGLERAVGIAADRGPPPAGLLDRALLRLLLTR